MYYNIYYVEKYGGYNKMKKIVAVLLCGMLASCITTSSGEYAHSEYTLGPRKIVKSSEQNSSQDPTNPTDPTDPSQGTTTTHQGKTSPDDLIEPWVLEAVNELETLVNAGVVFNGYNFEKSSTYDNKLLEATQTFSGGSVAKGFTVLVNGDDLGLEYTSFGSLRLKRSDSGVITDYNDYNFIFSKNDGENRVTIPEDTETMTFNGYAIASIEKKDNAEYGNDFGDATLVVKPNEEKLTVDWKGIQDITTLTKNDTGVSVEITPSSTVSDLATHETLFGGEISGATLEPEYYGAEGIATEAVGHFGFTSTNLAEDGTTTYNNVLNGVFGVKKQ